MFSLVSNLHSGRKFITISARERVGSASRAVIAYAERPSRGETDLQGKASWERGREVQAVPGALLLLLDQTEWNLQSRQPIALRSLPITTETVSPSTASRKEHRMPVWSVSGRAGQGLGGWTGGHLAHRKINMCFRMCVCRRRGRGGAHTAWTVTLPASQ